MVNKPILCSENMWMLEKIRHIYNRIVEEREFGIFGNKVTEK